MTLVTASLTSKAQLTLPKRVRELLGVRVRGDQVGFLVDEQSRRIIMTRVDVVPTVEPYNDAEIQKLFKLAKTRGGKTFSSAESFLKHIRSL